MNKGYASYIQEQNKDLETDHVRKDFTLSLTDKQYSNLKLMAYQVGYKNAGDFIQSFVGDLTGWSSNGSDERDLADQWYQRAHGNGEFTYYFHYFLFNYDYDLDTMMEMIEDEDYFEEAYEEYSEQAWKKEYQSREDCIQILKEIAKNGTEL
ncbi:hypothetical protein [Acetobacterium bakii]|nr:hypothetical protein [Acetobacterium bakii]